jgi:hypothetical protein
MMSFHTLASYFHENLFHYFKDYLMKKTDLMVKKEEGECQIFNFSVGKYLTPPPNFIHCKHMKTYPYIITCSPLKGKRQ